MDGRMIIPIKIQCGCGQIYEFDVEPVNGRMPQAVSCPVCCMDGTAVANEIIAQVLATQTQPSPITPSIPSKVKLEKSKAALWIYPSVGVVALVAVAAGLIWWKQRFPTKEQEVNRLEKTMKEAFAVKNPQLFLDQYYWEGTSDKDKQGMSETVSAFVTNGILTKLSFTPNASGKAETEMTVAGGILRPNLPVVGSINAEIVFDGKVKISNQFPVGETNGRMWIPGGGSFSAK
jgi:hypothetical protein